MLLLIRSPSASLIRPTMVDRKSTRLNSSHLVISYAVFCLKKKKKILVHHRDDRVSATLFVDFVVQSLHLPFNANVTLICSLRELVNGHIAEMTELVARCSQ